MIKIFLRKSSDYELIVTWYEHADDDEVTLLAYNERSVRQTTVALVFFSPSLSFFQVTLCMFDDERKFFSSSPSVLFRRYT